jgi:O-antigen/teichoic acid export membrane protein
MSVSNSIRQGVAWLFVGSTGNQVLSFLFGIVLARLLTPADFGMLVTIQIYTGLAGFVAGGGMGQALVQAREVRREDFHAVFTIQLTIGCLIYLAFFTAAPWFAAWHEPQYKELLRVSALSFVLRPFANLPSNHMYRERRFRSLAIANIGVLIASSASSITLASLGYGVWSLIIGGLAGALFGAVILIAQVGWAPRLSTKWKRARALAQYGMLVAVDDFIVYLRNQAPNFVLSRTLGAHSLGLFNKASSLAVIPQKVTASVYQVMFRALAKEQDNLSLGQYLYLRSITLVSVYTWPAFLALGWLALPLIRFVYGDKWTDAAPLLTWFSVTAPFLMLEMLAGSVLAARNWLGKEIPVQIAQLVIVLLGRAAGLSYGLLGVAVGASLATIYGACHLSWLASRCLQMPVRRVLRALWAPVLFVLALSVLWFCLAQLLTLWKVTGDLPYLLAMLGSGAIVVVCLFSFAPLPSIASERDRWCGTLKSLFAAVGRFKGVTLP